MTKRIPLATLAPLAPALAIALLAACSQEAEEPEAPPAPTMHEVMKDQIDANADKVWDISNTALDATAGIDPALLTDQQWADMAELAQKVEDGARTLATMDPIVVAAPGVKISDEDIENGHTAEQVQGYVDADPDLFHSLADTLANHMGEIVTAAQNKDAPALGPLVDQLDGVCESCHLEFWYPEQADLVRSLRQAGGDDPAPAEGE